MNYLVLPYARVQAASIFGSSFLVGGPPVFAAYGLGEALCHHLGGEAKVTGAALIHHDREALGQSFYGVFSPQQRRAAAFTFGKSANGSDYSSKNQHALSLQPVACAHLCVSLIWELENVDGTAEAGAFFDQAKFSGGLVTLHGKIAFEDSMTRALGHIGSGYVVVDRRDLLENREVSQAQLLVDALGTSPKTGESWLSAACLGYAAITPFERRAQVRGGYTHAFAEPLVGMTQYRSLRQWQKEADAEDALWRPVWLDEQEAFVLRQEKIEDL